MSWYEPVTKTVGPTFGAKWFLPKTYGKEQSSYYYNSDSKITVPVPIHTKDMKKGTFLGILKDAGIDTSNLD
ncbi:type II toxin-antitoxin system HicA family toxin [Spirosoma utsteinense]|uniref:type II toxin-antitoxin system HicA family toxin n=1 Tax=Spirosoma utsteinense TaxID=2585773 RepID=UPI001F31D360|nr:type II toxin-antitoxin system HicA family toxin [Spirosoma utsteinense]